MQDTKEISAKMIAEAQINDLIIDILELPEQLLNLRAKRLTFAALLREADEDLAIAKMPLEVQAYTVVPGEKSNEDLRDLKLRKLQLTDPDYRAAKEAKAKIEGSIAAVDITIKHLEERFTATKAVAKLETARLSFLAEE